MQIVWEVVWILAGLWKRSTQLRIVSTEFTCTVCTEGE